MKNKIVLISLFVFANIAGIVYSQKSEAVIGDQVFTCFNHDTPFAVVMGQAACPASPTDPSKHLKHLPTDPECILRRPAW